MISDFMFFYVFIFLIVCCYCQDEQLAFEKKLLCVDHDSCGACVTAASHCRWCSDPYLYKDDNDTRTPRCNDESSLLEAGCSQYLILSTPASHVTTVSDDSLSDMLSDTNTSAVQIKPQHVKIALKPFETKSVKFTYRPALNYPLDIYYLMDLTISMRDDKQTLVSLSDDLGKVLKNLTDNFRVGFGSFAEKPLMPFTYVDSERRKNPCRPEREVCEPTYCFRHHMTLTDQVEEFIRRVNATQVTANVDNAECGLEALLQTSVCVDTIGWREHARKIVILLSDGLLHHAGDGKLGGVIKPNDEVCRLDEVGFYTGSEMFDYPSFQQMQRILEQHKINVIFAVTKEVKWQYDSLYELWNENTYVGELESNGTNILKLVKRGYDDLVKLIHFEYELDVDSPLKIQIYSNCGVLGSEMIETSKCKDIEFGVNYEFEVKITLEYCPKYEYGQHYSINILETQLGEDSLKLEVELLCGCECEVANDTSFTNLGLCPQNSEMVCGQCNCIGDWSGPNCDCLWTAESALQWSQSCVETNETKLVCHGAGDCVCGICQCDQGFNGKYCQCGPCPISRESRQECGGHERGHCFCGLCQCKDGWAGPSCDCDIRQDNCRPPHDPTAMLCSGRGECVCGSCECSLDESGIRSRGTWCEQCTDCDNPLCDASAPCVRCMVLPHNTTDDCISVCSTDSIRYDVVEDSVDEKSESSSFESWCITRYDDDDKPCQTRYTYNSILSTTTVRGHYDHGGNRIVKIKIKDSYCSQARSAAIFLGGLTIMLTVVGIGLLVSIIVKVFNVIAERRDFNKWKLEAERARLGSNEMNPLYVSPITQFKPPSDLKME